jgi:hypothetical protein
VYVDDLHWFDNQSAQVQQQALSSADVILATYAYDWALLYPVLFETRRQKIAWLPHGAMPEFFLPLRSYRRALKRVLLAG